eukprot:990067_1
MDAEDEDYGDSSRRKSSGGNRRDADCVKELCIGKGLCAILCGVCAILCMIISFSINEITENISTVDANGITVGINLACGWNKPVNLNGKDGDVTFTELCDATGEGSASCTNKFAGEMWLLLGLCSFFITIGAIIATVIFWLCDCECLNCWIRIIWAATLCCTLGGIIQYVLITQCENCCYDTTGANEPIMRASQYMAAIAAIFQMIATICSCGLGWESD